MHSYTRRLLCTYSSGRGRRSRIRGREEFYIVCDFLTGALPRVHEIDGEESQQKEYKMIL